MCWGEGSKRAGVQGVVICKTGLLADPRESLDTHCTLGWAGMESSNVETSLGGQHQLEMARRVLD